MQRRPSRRTPRSSSTGSLPSFSDAARGGGEGQGRPSPSLSLSRTPPRFPRSFIGALMIFGGGTIVVLILRLTSMSSSTTSISSSGMRGNNAANDIPKLSSAAALSDAVAVRPQTPLHPVGIASPATNATLHVIFSTDCSSYQHWQSYLFFHSALKVQQPGYVTRIASGCDDKDREKEKQWHHDHIQSKMSDRFRIHFTPHFSGVKDEETGKVKGDYKFFNKPFGLKHFMENFSLLGFDQGGKEMRNPNDVIILTDPDFLLLRPLTDDFSSTRETLVGKRRKSIYEKKDSHIVTHGNPYAQTYGLGTQWRKFDLDDIAGPNSPAKDVDQAEGGLYYPVGPPYIVTAKDMHNIAVTWSDFAPRVHKQYPHLLAEMYAYCIAAAHLRLPHMLVDSLMVSASGIGGEGWKFVKDVPAREVCAFASHPNHIVHPVPSVIHYCQRYHVDRYFWGKRKVPKDIFTCEHPLLVEPPMDLGSGKYLAAITNARTMKKKEMTAEKEKMEAFMVCALTRATNDAMENFKTEHCGGGGNREKTYSMLAGKNIVDS